MNLAFANLLAGFATPKLCYCEAKAGPPGLEPGTAVLETAVLPLNYRPLLLFGFLMRCFYFTPFAKFLKLDSSFYFFLILPCPVVNSLALLAR